MTRRPRWDERWSIGFRQFPCRPSPLKKVRKPQVRVCFTSSPTSANGKWLLDIFKVYQLKSGELREVKPMYSLAEMLMRQPGYLSELDLRIARLLVAMHSHHAYYSGYPLEGSSGAELLEMLLRTSRLFLDFEDLRALTPGLNASVSSLGPSRLTADSARNGAVPKPRRKPCWRWSRFITLIVSSAGWPAVH